MTIVRHEKRTFVELNDFFRPNVQVSGLTKVDLFAFTYADMNSSSVCDYDLFLKQQSDNYAQEVTSKVNKRNDNDCEEAKEECEDTSNRTH